MREVDFHPGARSDYDESFDWYAQRSQRAAIAFATAIDEVIERISVDPDRFLRLDDLHGECPVMRFPFRVIFRKQENRLVIVAIAHAKRHPVYWRGRADSQS